MKRPASGAILEAMSDAPDNHELARQVAVLEERMNTMQADLSATLERFRADMARLSEGMARRDTEAAKRETRMLLAVAAMIGLAVAILGFLI